MAEEGDTVAVHYHGTLQNGEVFDSSRERDPFEFTVGANEVIEGFDSAVRGLAIGDSVTVTLPPEQAYGERSDQAVFQVPSAGAPPNLSVGDQVTLGNGAPAVVVAIAEETITVDANHQLAGQTLTFEIELVEIR